MVQYQSNFDSFTFELSENYHREKNTAKATLDKDKSIKGVSKAVKEFYKRLDKQIAKNITEHDIKLDCQKGCSHCCKLRVEIFGYEAVAIAKYIQDTFSDEDKEVCISKLNEASIKAKGLQPETHFVPCAFLKDNSCSIYEMRPAMCRKFSSLSLAACLNNGGGLESHGLKQMSMAAIQGFVEGTRQAGLKPSLYELNQTLFVALSNRTASKDWLKGINVFPMLPPISQSIYHDQNKR